jgi:4-coumarate--CoA ligase
MDDEGRLFVVDRKADLLKNEDVLVSPSEVEDVLQSYPGIMDAAVVGLDGKEQINLRAFIVLRPEKVKDNQIKVYDADVDHKVLPDQGQVAKDIENFIASKLIKQKHLTEGVVFLTKIPKSTNSKILRKKLKELSE